MLLVDATARSVTCIVDSADQRLAVPQIAAEALRTQRVLIRTRRDAEQAREGPLQMEGAGADVRGERRQRDRLVRMRGDEARGLAHVFDAGRGRRTSTRAAAAALAEAGDLREVGAREEADGLALRPAARAARPAIDTSRSDGIDEAAIARGIARQHRLPKRIVGYIHSVVSGFSRTNHVHHHAATIAAAAAAIYPPLALVITCRNRAAPPAQRAADCADRHSGRHRGGRVLGTQRGSG